MNFCSSDNSLSETSVPKVAYATLPYKEKVEEKLLKSPQKLFEKLLPKKVETRIAYTITKLRSKFAIKD